MVSVVWGEKEGPHALCVYTLSVYSIWTCTCFQALRGGKTNLTTGVKVELFLLFSRLPMDVELNTNMLSIESHGNLKLE